MSKYILVLLWLTIVALMASQGRLKREEMVCGRMEHRYPYWFAFVVFIPIILMAGFRGTTFADSSTYAGTFKSLPNSLAGIIAYASAVDKDKGFYFFAGIIKLIFGESVNVYFLLVAAIQGIILLTIYRKYSSRYLMSVFLFLASTDYISWMFNGMRQFLAVTLIFAATGLMLRRKWLSTIVVILIASLFHQSALVMVPIVLIAQGAAWNKKTIVFIISALVVIVFVGEFTNLLDGVLSNTQYADVVTNYTKSEDDGTNPIRVVVYAIPAILAFIGRTRIRKSDNVLIHFCTNMSLIVAGMYVVSMFTSGIYMGRLPIYASLYGYIFLPWEIDHLFTPSSRKLIYCVMVVLYLTFYYYQMHFVWNLI